MVPEQLLPLADHPEVVVVHDEHLDRDPLLRARRELLHVHLDRAVAGDADDRLVRTADLRAHRGRQPEAHRAETAGVDPPARRREVVVLRRPHLVLADVGDDDRVAAGRLVQRLDHVLGLDLGIARSPRSRSGWRSCQTRIRDHHSSSRAGSGSSARYSAVRRGRMLAASPTIGMCGRHVLGDLGRVDVDVDELGARRELRQLAGDPIVEASADGDDQVRLVHRVVGRPGAVHAEHPQPLLVRRRETRRAPSPCR